MTVPEAVEPLTSAIDEPKFFFSKSYPHQWNGSPKIIISDAERGWELIESLERAKELAEEARVGGRSIDRCETGYGILYYTKR